KTKSLTRQAHAVTLLQPAVNLGQTVIRPRIDASYLFEGFAPAVFAPPTSDWNHPLELRGFNSAELLSIAAGSAAEHGVINSFLNLTNGVSTFKLLQAAGKTNILHATLDNYERLATNIYNGTMLKDHDPALWSAVVD